jgi:hypothetical protein
VKRTFLLRRKQKKLLETNTHNLFDREVKMSRKIHFVVSVLTVLAVVLMFCFSAGYAETISGRLVSTFDSQTGKATTFFAGYSKDQPVVIGPSTMAETAKSFTACTRDNVGQLFAAQDIVIKRVTKFSNNGREIMAEIVMER